MIKHLEKTQVNLLFISKCSSFSEISTYKVGSIFDYSGDSIFVAGCTFNNIFSSLCPACFKINNSNLTIQYFFFFDRCRGNNVNPYYGNAFSANWNSEISYITFILCSPETTNAADFAIAIRDWKIIHCKINNNLFVMVKMEN